MGLTKGGLGKIGSCVEPISFSKLINGKSSEVFKPSRDLRQEDHLPPHMFFMCVKGLSAMFKIEIPLNSIQGIKITKNCLALMHLFFFFCNDILLFRGSTK